MATSPVCDRFRVTNDELKEQGAEHLQGLGVPCDPRSVWQARFYDFNVYSEGRRKEELNQMHANPVICGLVKHPKDWAWSSWNFYYRGEGMLGMDSEGAPNWGKQ